MTKSVETNLRKLQPSRKKPTPGDVFAMHPADGLYLFGRVVDIEAAPGFGPPTAVLIYVYRVRSERMELPERSELRPDRLLVSPMMTNRLPWSRGYFQTVAHLPLDAEDVINRHCFLSAVRGRYFDERGNELPGPIEPVGDYGLHSFRTIDDEISDALVRALDCVPRSCSACNGLVEAGVGFKDSIVTLRRRSGPKNQISLFNWILCVWSY